MNKYLLEIGTEELAYKFIPSAVEQLKDEFTKSLEENNIKITIDDIKVFATPRRLAVLIENLPEKQADIKKLIKGPILSAAYDENGNLTKAAIGFAAKNNIPVEKLFKKDNYLWAQIEQNGKSIQEILKSIVPIIILSLKGTHFMRWADLDIKFQRPIRWIVSLLNSEIVDFEFANIKAGNITRGHRFSAQKEVVISNPDEYLTKLRNANVIADIEERKNLIKNEAQKKAKEIGSDILIDENLLDEVTFITEYPVPVVCSFDEKYLKIPSKVTVTVMAVHQRYFPLFKNGKLLNKFITISNYTGKNFENIKAGNERVVTARLEDAVFFVEEDTKKKLQDYIEGLEGVTFQKGLGNMKDKTNRIVELSKYILKNLNVKNPDYVIRTAELCKADLVTKLVFEFTELQGFIGSDYALRSGEAKEVAKGIEEHYFPLNAYSELAGSEEGQIVGIADKIDTVTAVFASGKKVSGSQDPLGVRRCALGIIRTLLEKQNLKINLDELIDKTIELLPVKVDDSVKLKKDILDFIKSRLVIYLNTVKGEPKDILEACISNKEIFKYNINDFMMRVASVKRLENNSSFIEAINRIVRILKPENNLSFKVDEEYLKSASNEEKELYYSAKNINDNISYFDLEQELKKLPITEFFNKVLVMDKDDYIKQNRLNLLNVVKSKFDKIADFSKISK